MVTDDCNRTMLGSEAGGPDQPELQDEAPLKGEGRRERRREEERERERKEWQENKFCFAPQNTREPDGRQHTPLHTAEYTDSIPHKGNNCVILNICLWSHMFLK